MKLYLGDSVYVDRWEDGLVLTTENGGMPSNQIFLDAAVVASLLDYIEHLQATGVWETEEEDGAR